VWIDGRGRKEPVDPQVRAQVLRMNGKALAHELKGLGKQKPPMSPSAAERLSELNLPVLIVYGDLDTPYTIKAAEYMEQHIKGAKKVLIPNTAHLPNLERPAEFNQIVLDFLSKVGK
jgi:pimeloyl-ACP methyl ester carboxylesterase